MTTDPYGNENGEQRESRTDNGRAYQPDEIQLPGEYGGTSSHYDKDEGHGYDRKDIRGGDRGSQSSDRRDETQETSSVNYERSRQDATKGDSGRQESRQSRSWDYEEKPRTHLGLAIIVTIFFNFLCGLISLWNAGRVNAYWYAGEEELSQRASRRAKTWGMIGLIIGCLVIYRVLNNGMSGVYSNQILHL